MEQENHSKIVKQDVGFVERDESIDIANVMKQAGRSVNESTEQSIYPSEEHHVFKTETNQHTANHGDIVTMDDGTTGIVIDMDKEREDLLKSVKNPKLDKLVDESIPMYDKMSGEAPNGAIDYSSKIVQVEPGCVDSASLADNIKKAYANFAPTLYGVAPVDSEESQAFQHMKDLLRSGEVVLPTVEEYDNQIAMMEKKKEEQEKMEQQYEENVVQTPVQQNVPREPINIAEMENQYAQQVQQIAQVQAEEPKSSQHMNPQHVTEFKVPEGKAEVFIETLRPEDRNKVEASKVIKVQEERMVKVPKATRKITNLDDYKRISQNKAISEAVEVPLLNSGYIAVVNGCGSLEMAAILPNLDDLEWDDYAKLYSFCFRRLVNTSIGTLSFRDFQNETSPLDLPQLVYGILRASQPDVSSITLVCGNSNCRKDYDIEYSLQSLPDWDDIDEDLMKRIDDIVRVRGMIEDARKLHNESPVMTGQYIDVGGGKIVSIQIPNGPMAVERTNEELLQKIADATSPLVAMFLINIKSIFITVTDDDGNEEVFELVDMMSIASELQTFSDTQLEILKDAMSKLDSYEGITYSFKSLKGNEIVCPHCGLTNKKIPCKVQQLVFHKVSKAMN